MLQLTFNPGLTLTGFRTTRPCFAKLATAVSRRRFATAVTSIDERRKQVFKRALVIYIFLNPKLSSRYRENLI